ncbi:MAG TPA: exodeoxyribonuclease III [Anaerolineae bacterium]|nr:exodeoxyribonuclease III [Anaerolineae bacterium]HQK13067.1 exodeoxyribonuclease III [Anaerolineae bacterium]
MSTFKIATFNANSIRSRLEQILAWLDREAPDVLCIQETKVQDQDFPAQPIMEAGYHVIFRGQKAYAGVAIISRETPQDVAAGLDDGEEADEPRLLRAVYHGIAVVNTYVPQGREPESEHFQYKLRWLKRLRAFFERHYTPNDLLVWVGDLNVAPEDIDVYDPKGLRYHVDFHPEAQAALEYVRQWGFVDVFRKHHPNEPGQFSYFDYRTRNAIERGIGWRVDHIWATAPLAARSTRAWIDVEARKAERPSDHVPLVAEFIL